MKRFLTIIIIIIIGGCNLIAQSSTTIHTVQRGETLASIAKNYGVTEKQIIEANPDAAQFIYVGMELTIPVRSEKHLNINEYISNDDSNETMPSNNENITYNNITPKELYRPTESTNLFLAIQGGFGYSNFMWSDGSVNGDMSYSADIVGQLYFEDNVGFIPRNWYAEIALGYDKRGAAKFSMEYIHAKIHPFGYRIPISSIDLIFKGGIALGFPLNELKTDSESWSADLQIGIGGGFQIDWKRIAIGCNIEYDFTKVSSSCSPKLNNIAVLGTFSYKLSKL